MKRISLSLFSVLLAACGNSSAPDLAGTPVTPPVVVSNSAPTARTDNAVVGASSTANPVDVLANDLDVDGDALSIASVRILYSLPPSSTGVASIAPGGQTLRYTPPSGFVGQQTLLYQVSDGHGHLVNGLALITISLLPVPPVALPDVYTLTPGSAQSLNVLANDVDSAGGGLTLVSASRVASVPPGSTGAVSVSGNRVSYTAASGFTGVDTLSYTLRDANGATATATVLVTVLPLAAPPVALPDVFTVATGSSAQVLDVLLNDVDLSGGGLSLTEVSAVTTVPLGSNGSFSIGSGTLLYTPASGFTGVQTASYTVEDGNGSSATGLVTLVVSALPLELPPVALPDVAVLAANSSNNAINVLLNDVDASASGLTISAASISLTIPTATGATLSNNGSELRFTPPLGFAGVVTLSYTVTDGNGNTATAPVVVTVTPGLPAALPPIAVPDVATVAQDSGATNVDVLANDVDVAGGGLVLSAPSVTASLPITTHSVSVNGNQLRFTPAAGFAGVVTVSYTATDTNGNSATGLLNLVVTPTALALPPVALPDVGLASSLLGLPLTYDVLLNDVDPAGGGLTLSSAAITLAVPTGAGSVAIVGNQVQYTPSAAYVGVVTVGYTATDSNGTSTSSTLVLTVLP